MKSNLHMISLANTLLKTGEKKQIELSPLKLQKLMYITSGILLSEDKEIEIDFEAWPLGPVSPEVYHRVKIFGANTITVLIPDDNNNIYRLKTHFVTAKNVLIEYGRLSASRLVDITHGKAWRDTYKNGAGKGEKIPSQSISEEFKKNEW